MSEIAKSKLFCKEIEKCLKESKELWRKDIVNIGKYENKGAEENKIGAKTSE
jgi:hypothetical protein